MKKFFIWFPKWYWAKLKTDRVFLLMQLSMWGNIAVSVFAAPQSLLPCRLIFISGLTFGFGAELRSLNRDRKRFNSNKKQLDFWRAECDRLAREVHDARSSYDQEKELVALERYKVAVGRFVKETQLVYPGLRLEEKS